MTRIVLLIVLGIGLQGCALIQKPQQTRMNTLDNLPDVPQLWCFYEAPLVDFENNCDIQAWLHYWVTWDSKTWTARRNEIESLGDRASDTMKKILLSQGKGTPYQARLRAQVWADGLFSELSAELQVLLNVLVYRPSQEILEFESALTILTRMNTNQSKALDAQNARLEEQQKQIEQLLQIEANMMQKREGSKP